MLRDPVIGGIAQLAEHELCKLGVTGSIPVASTYFARKAKEVRAVALAKAGLVMGCLYPGRVAQSVRAHP